MDNLQTAWPGFLIKLESTRGAYAYAVRAEPDSAVLIDTGLPGRSERILEELRRHGIERVSDIVVTHGDVDHVGNLAALAEATGADVWLPAGDRPYIVDGQPRPGVKRLIAALVRVKVPDRVRDLTDGDRVGPVTAVATPGHTPGHLAFRGDGFVATGDAFTVRQGSVVPSRGFLAWDDAKAAASAHNVMDGFRGWVLPAHQEPLWYGDDL